jgi:fluoride exporter
MNNYLLVFIGGGVGSILRFGIAEFFRNYYKISFPISTLVSNILSCLLLVFTINYIQQRADLNNVKLLIITGICGGFSTFSTFSFETFELLKTGQTLYAILNITLSITACLLLLWMLSKN